LLHPLQIGTVGHMTHAISSPGEVPEWTLGDRLYKARKRANGGNGWSQQELADAIGISRNSVSRYEDDEYVPSIGILVNWAMATGVDSDWLVGGSPFPRRRRRSPVTMQYQHDGGRHPFPGWARSPIETAA
jgi:DNA-binding XRE family transcriptional regulator